MARMTLRLPDDLHGKLQALSRSNGTSLNQTIVTILRDALAGRKMARAKAIAPEDETPLQKERRLVREALGDLVGDIDPNDFAPYLQPLPEGFDREAFFNSLPRLDPPLSQTIIEEREDRI